MSSPISSFLPTPPITQEELLKELPYCQRFQFGVGTVIVKESTLAESCYYILSGRIQVSKRMPNGEELPLATVEAGEFFGEMAMLSGYPRSASATAVTNLEVLEIKRSDLQSLLDLRNPFAARLSLHFATALSRRSSRILAMLASETDGVIVPPAGPKLEIVRRPEELRATLQGVYALWSD